jgi:carboxymethylenebutenolidase
MSYLGMHAEVVSFTAHNGDKGEAYYARPTNPGRFGGVVLIHHMPGWDEFCVEATRKLAHHGLLAIDPNLYFRAGPGSPDDQAAKARAEGGVADDQVVGDIKGAMEFLRAQPQSNGKVGVIGFCSGGRETYLCACRLGGGIDAAVDCWGGNVVAPREALTAKKPVAPIDLTAGIQCPIMGLFGNEDANPTAEAVNQTEAALKQHGKTYEFHRYDNAGHAFFAHYRPNYRVEPAVDGWNKAFQFFGKHLAK